MGNSHIFRYDMYLSVRGIGPWYNCLHVSSFSKVIFHGVLMQSVWVDNKQNICEKTNELLCQVVACSKI